MNLLADGYSLGPSNSSRVYYSYHLEIHGIVLLNAASLKLKKVDINIRIISFNVSISPHALAQTIRNKLPSPEIEFVSKILNRICSLVVFIKASRTTQFPNLISDQVPSFNSYSQLQLVTIRLGSSWDSKTPLPAYSILRLDLSNSGALEFPIFSTFGWLML